MLVKLYDTDNTIFEVNPNVAVKLLRTGKWSKTPHSVEQEPPAAESVLPQERRPRRRRRKG